MSTISTTIITNVTLGTAAYPSPLNITRTGAVAPAKYTAIYSNLAGNRLINHGAVDGGYGATSVDLVLGRLFNEGQITGGDGGKVAGGAGVEMAGGATVLNHGAIAGGKCNGGAGGAGGAGIVQGGGKLSNYATISGGTSARYVHASGPGGEGVDLSAGTLMNLGTITGGNGPSGGAGVYMSGGTLTNAERITGGTGAMTILVQVASGLNSCQVR